MSDVFNQAIPGKVAQSTDEDMAEQTAEMMERISKHQTYDLPAIYHEHDGSTEHKHENKGPGHYMGQSGHYHLTEVFTGEEVAAALGITEDNEV